MKTFISALHPNYRQSATIQSRKQRGFTLIEILVTMVVLAIGALGLAALQSVAMQTGQTSYYRTQATNLAYEITDYARAHRSRLADGVFAIGDVEDLFEDRMTDDYGTPLGDVDITFIDDTRLNVTIFWSEERIDGNNADTTGDFVFETRI